MRASPRASSTARNSRGLLDAELGRRSTAEWLERFAGTVPAAPIHDLAQALENPFVTEHGRLQTLLHPRAGPYRLVAPPVRSGDETAPARPAPALGEHTGELLHELGYDDGAIEQWKAEGVV